MAAEVADQTEVAVGLKVLTGLRPAALRERYPEDLRQREVVVDARNRLHETAVAVAQAQAVNGFGAGDVRAAVAADRDVLVLAEDAGHAARPQEFVLQVLIDVAVHVRELTDGGVRIRVHAGDELELGLGEIRGDVGVGQR